MFAIVATSGKQFRVFEGDRILVDRVPEDVGAQVRLDSVLMLGGEDRPVGRAVEVLRAEEVGDVVATSSL